MQITFVQMVVFCLKITVKLNTDKLITKPNVKTSHKKTPNDHLKTKSTCYVIRCPINADTFFDPRGVRSNELNNRN